MVSYLQPASCTTACRRLGNVGLNKITGRPSLLNVRWEEERYTDGVKWKFLEHKGPVFAPPYEPLPNNVKFYYDGKNMQNGACFKST